MKYKWMPWVLAVAVLIFTGWKAYQKYTGERNGRIIAEFQLKGQIQLTEWTAGRLAQADIDKNEMRALIEASNKINGKLIATMGIFIAQRDTSVTHPELPTVATDGSRSATFADSAFGVRIDGKVSAPPYPGALGIQYQFTRRPFHPTIGFSQVGDSVVALVNWEGEEVEIRSPSFKGLQPKSSHIGAFVEANYAPFGNNIEGRVGGRLSAGKWHLQGIVSQEVPLQLRRMVGPDLRVGLRRDFY